MTARPVELTWVQLMMLCMVLGTTNLTPPEPDPEPVYPDDDGVTK